MAYVLYKQEKIDYIEGIVSAHNRAPTDDELKSFHSLTSKDTKIQEYRKQAKQLWDDALKIAAEHKIQELEADVQAGIVNSNVLTVLRELQAKKGFVAWLGDMVSNVGVNLLTILVIGALLGGYQALAQFNSILERLSKIPTSDEPVKTQATTAALPAPVSLQPSAADPKSSQAPAGKANKTKSSAATPVPQE